MSRIITEDMIEQAAIKQLVEVNQYETMNCYTPEKETLPDGTGRQNKKQVVLPNILFSKLCEINPGIPEATIQSVAQNLQYTPPYWRFDGDELLKLSNDQNWYKGRL